MSGTPVRTIDYTAFGKPELITDNGNTVEVIYGPELNRIKRVDNGAGTTVYVGGNYEFVDGYIHRHYLGDFAVMEQMEGSTEKDYTYLHRDHLGSIVAKSKGTVAVSDDITRLANGPWGRRLEEKWDGAALPNSYLPDATPRGFTDHEHLDPVGLIHMNGRVYDPVLGRFVSADPIVQAPFNTQSYNRYSYVFNNPLSFTDPSGFAATDCVATDGHGGTIPCINLKPPSLGELPEPELSNISKFSLSFDVGSVDFGLGANFSSVNGLDDAQGVLVASSAMHQGLITRLSTSDETFESIQETDEKISEVTVNVTLIALGAGEVVVAVRAGYAILKGGKVVATFRTLTEALKFGGNGNVTRGQAVGTLIRTLQGRAGQLVREGHLVGGNPRNIRMISSGRLRGFRSIDTTATGGASSAQTLFRSLSGRGPSGSFDRFVADDGLEVLFRGASRTGTPKIEIINRATQIREKVTFLP